MYATLRHLPHPPIPLAQTHTDTQLLPHSCGFSQHAAATPLPPYQLIYCRFGRLATTSPLPPYLPVSGSPRHRAPPPLIPLIATTFRWPATALPHTLDITTLWQTTKARDRSPFPHNFSHFAAAHDNAQQPSPFLTLLPTSGNPRQPAMRFSTIANNTIGAKSVAIQQHKYVPYRNVFTKLPTCAASFDG